MKHVCCLLLLASIPVLAYNNGVVPVNTTASARRMIEDLNRTYGDAFTGGSEFLQRLEAIEAALTKDGDDKDAQQALATLIREASLANPLLDFADLLVIRRKGEANRSLNSHTTATIKPTGRDNDIAALSNLRGDVKARSVYRHRDQSVMKHMELHWSGERIMFSGVGKNGRWAVLDVDLHGGDLRELTPSDQPDVDWFDSCYLPAKGQIVVCSTAGMQGLPCENGGKPMVNLYRVDTTNGKVRQLTFEQDSDWHPRVLQNGEVMYLRWEYTDISHYYSRYLFRMHPDGRTQLALWGSGSYFPTAFVWARPTPGVGSSILGIVSGHHAKSETGRLLLIDPALGRKYPFRYRPDDKVWGPEKGEINIHPEVFPATVTGCIQEIPGWGRDVVGNVYDNQGGGQTYTFGTPWPLSEKYFLVSMKGFQGNKWTVCLVDVFDNMTLLHEDPEYDLFEPMPLAAREAPPVLDDLTVEGKPAVIFCSDIYSGPGLAGIPRGVVKRLRVFGYHYGFIRSGGHESCGLESSWDIKRILGTVPVEADGSFSFVAPANTPLAIQPLDEDGAALALMRSWMVAMPGEALGCTGCHEPQNTATPVIAARAGRRAPSRIEPWYGPTRPFSYAAEIQPVLDTYCISCHKAGGGEPSPTAPFALEAGDPNNWRQDKSYLNLAAFVRRPGPESDNDLFNPMEWHASTSPLVQMLRKGHHGVSIDRESWERLYAWIDLNAPHRGMWNNVEYEGKRLELSKRYAGVADNPEEEHRRTLAALAGRTKPQPILPSETPQRGPDGLRVKGFPMGREQAKVLQGSDREMAIVLPGGVAMHLVRIPAGSFVMGSQHGYADEAPRAVVQIDKPFAMAVTEVTCRQYAAFDPDHDNRYLDEHGKDHSVPGHIANHPDQPVARISWQEARAFCDWLSRTCGLSARLPTEAEWEWAARAGSDGQFFYGDRDTDFSTWANLADAGRRRSYIRYDGGSRIHQPLDYPKDYLFPLRDDRFVDHWPLVDFVKQYPPNAWGLHDMVGNVSEWTSSDYAPYPYRAGDGRNSGRLSAKKVARGGSWSDRPVDAGSAIRYPFESYQRIYNVGFRVVLDGVAPEKFSLPPVAAVARPPRSHVGQTRKPGEPVRTKLGMVTHAPGDFPNGELPEMVFDGTTSTKWYHGGATSTWIQCEFPKKAKKTVSAYRLASANDCAHRDPADWRLLGSNDGGKTWSTIDSRRGETFAARREMRTFTVETDVPYGVYRLCVDKSLEPRDGIQFSELELVEHTKTRKAPGKM